MRIMLLVACAAACGLEACKSNKSAQLDPDTQDLCPPDVECCPRCPAGTVCSGGSCEPFVTCHCPANTTCVSYGCDTTSGTCLENDAPATTACNDGNLCTLNDHCDGLGSCVGSTTVSCQTTNPCMPASCNGTASCSFTQLAAGSACNDGNACSYGDVCDANAVCGGTPITCNSNICQTSSCNGTSSCSVTTLSGCACALSYNRFLSETGSDITAADAPNYGHWQAASFFNRAAQSDVYAVKTANTASGNVEVDVLDGSKSFILLQYFAAGDPNPKTAHYVTPIPVTAAGDYRWAITNYITGVVGQTLKSLVAIKVQNTVSGKVEVSVLDGNQNMAAYSLQNAVTPISTSDAPNLRFVTGDIAVLGSVPPAHIYVVRVAGSTSGKVELSMLDRNTNYTTLTPAAATAIPISDAPLFAGWAVADYPGCSGQFDNIFDLYGFKTQNTAGNVEVHVLDGTNLTSYLHLTTSAITRPDASNFVWSVDDFASNSAPDVYAIKLRNTGTGKAEIHVLSGAP